MSCPGPALSAACAADRTVGPPSDRKRAPVNATTVVIIGAGQAGLAMSWHLRDRSIDHVVLERAEIANSWANERWDSLCLLTPNWLTRLPGAEYDGVDPDGYMTAAELVERLRRYGADAPVITGAEVLDVRTTAEGFEVDTACGSWACASVVLAVGASNNPYVPPVASQFPATAAHLTPIEYRSPEQLVDGPILIVGASASGAQLADEIARAGRDVTLAVGRHRRMIRCYRGRDIFWWMETIGMLDDVPDPLNLEGERQLPSLQLVGTPNSVNLDLETLAANGVRLVGRIESVNGTVAELGTSVALDSRNADVELNAILNRIDQYVDDNDLGGEVDAVERPRPVPVPEMPEQLEIGEFTTVIWATGFKPHLPWLEADLVDARGGVVHDGGVMKRPGMFITGMPFGRRRRSGFIDGAGPDAEDLSALVAHHLEGRR